MTVREYLEAIGKYNTSRTEQLTFLIGMATKDEHTPFYHLRYDNSPIRCIYEWVRLDGKIMDYHVIKESHPPIDAGSGWLNWYNKGHLMCMLVVSTEDINKIYGKEQAESYIAYREEEIRARINK